jgi:hypothetical protein
MYPMEALCQTALYLLDFITKKNRGAMAVCGIEIAVKYHGNIRYRHFENGNCSKKANHSKE